MIPIGGLVPFTTIDYPNHLSAVLFCQGCPWRCGYCHNPHLQPFQGEGLYAWEKVVQFLESRKGLLDGVVLSGGEPSLHPRLPEAISELRGMGFDVGLHTAGISPSRLEAILPLVQWVGMDIKAPFAKYPKITGKMGSGYHAQESARLIVNSGVPYEFRTTVHSHLLTEEDLKTLVAELLALGAESYVLQQFRNEGCIDEVLIRTPSSFSETLAQSFEPRFKTFFTR